MRIEDFELLYQLEENFWWFAAMRRITDTILRRELEKPGLRLLDAGCGTGFNITHYAAGCSRDVYGLDIADAAIERVRKRGIRQIVQGSVTEIPFTDEAFGLVLSFEVVTQLPYEMHDAAMQEMHRVLNPGGLLFLRVPAFMWLRSSHDETIRAYYRYRRDELQGKLIGNGFKVEWISYANTVLFPIILFRLVLKRIGLASGSDVRPFPRPFRWLNSVLRAVLQREADWFKAGKTFPFGLSLVCCARKDSKAGHH